MAKKEIHNVKYSMDGVGYHCEEKADSLKKAKQKVAARLKEQYPESEVKFEDEREEEVESGDPSIVEIESAE